MVVVGISYKIANVQFLVDVVDIAMFYIYMVIWISNHMHSKVWDEITYPFLNFNGCTVEV